MASASSNNYYFNNSGLNKNIDINNLRINTNNTNINYKKFGYDMAHALDFIDKHLDNTFKIYISGFYLKHSIKEKDLLTNILLKILNDYRNNKNDAKLQKRCFDIFTRIKKLENGQNIQTLRTYLPTALFNFVKRLKETENENLKTKLITRIINDYNLNEEKYRELLENELKYMMNIQTDEEIRKRCNSFVKSVKKTDFKKR